MQSETLMFSNTMCLSFLYKWISGAFYIDMSDAENNLKTVEHTDIQLV